MSDTEILVGEAMKLCEAGNSDKAWGIAEMLMDQDPNSAAAVSLATYVSWKMHKLSLSYQLAVRATQIGPLIPTTWMRLGIAANEIWQVDASETAFKTGLRIAQRKEEKAALEINYSALLLDTGRFKEAEEHARRAVELNPGSPKAQANIGLAMLGQRNWKGWELYSNTLGLPGRRQMKYADEPVWDGTKGKTVVLYGEQGIGDELSFTSMLPDAIKDCGRIILDCDAKLENLFKRSFPGVKVYGTRWERVLNWDAEDRKPDFSVALGELGKFYRQTDESFTGKPFLVADPIRRQMWRTEFDKKKKPVIGIAWTGGMPWTGEKFRTLSLEQLKPLLSSVDAHWVSLQYKDASKEIEEFKKKNPSIDLVQYSWATLTKDYDDTAALVSEVDMVICIQTAVAHLSGALGKECFVLLPKNSQFKYGESGDTMPWYNSLRIFRQRSLKDWTGPIGSIIHALRQRYGQTRAAA